MPTPGLGDEIPEWLLKLHLSTISGRDMDFLRALAEDEEFSTAKDIGTQMGATSSTVGNHRARLLATGPIEPVRHGLVRFALPGLRDHLLRN